MERAAVDVLQLLAEAMDDSSPDQHWVVLKSLVGPRGVIVPDE